VVSLAVALACMLGWPQASHAQTPVTCGETLSGTGVLSGSCTGTITITKGTLQLGGFTLSGAGLAAVDCQGSCRVEGPGSIESLGSQFGILGASRVRVENVSISGHGTAGIKTGTFGGCRVEDSTITGNGTGIESTRIKVSNSSVDDNTGTGIVSVSRGVKLGDGTSVSGNGRHGIRTDISAEDANRAVFSDCFVDGNGEFGVIAKNVKAKRTTFNANGLGGVSADLSSPTPNRAQLTDCEVNLNGETGVSGKTVKLKRTTVAFNVKDGVSTEISEEDKNLAQISACTIAFNGEFGVIAKSIKYSASTIRANGLDAACGVTVPCVDLASVEMPSFGGGSLCDTSLQLPPVFPPPPPFGASWAICLDDF